MEILGVLLGIQLSAFVAAVYLGNHFRKQALKNIDALVERMTALERRKSQVAEMPANQPQTAKASQLRPRTWSEDMGAAEAK